VLDVVSDVEVDGDVGAQLLVLVLVDLELQLGGVDAGHGHGVPRAQAQLLQVSPIRVELQPTWRDPSGGALESRSTIGCLASGGVPLVGGHCVM
jgi:hypothetical protein